MPSHTWTLSQPKTTGPQATTATGKTSGNTTTTTATTSTARQQQQQQKQHAASFSAPQHATAAPNIRFNYPHGPSRLSTTHQPPFGPNSRTMHHHPPPRAPTSPTVAPPQPSHGGPHAGGVATGGPHAVGPPMSAAGGRFIPPGGAQLVPSKPGGDVSRGVRPILSPVPFTSRPVPPNGGNHSSTKRPPGGFPGPRFNNPHHRPVKLTSHIPGQSQSKHPSVQIHSSRSTNAKPSSSSAAKHAAPTAAAIPAPASHTQVPRLSEPQASSSGQRRATATSSSIPPGPPTVSRTQSAHRHGSTSGQTSVPSRLSRSASNVQTASSNRHANGHSSNAGKHKDQKTRTSSSSSSPGESSTTTVTTASSTTLEGNSRTTLTSSTSLHNRSSTATTSSAASPRPSTSAGNSGGRPESSRTTGDSRTSVTSTSHEQQQRRSRHPPEPSRQRAHTVDRSSQTQGDHPPARTDDVHIDINHRTDQPRDQRPRRNHRNRGEALPDILNSHVAPPYDPHEANRRHRTRGGRGHHRRRRGTRGQTSLAEDPGCCCGCGFCLKCITAITTFRWVLVILALLGVFCVVSGIVLGTLCMTLDLDYLMLSLMFIGLGVILVLVVGIGWKCTPPGHEPCHLLFGLGQHNTSARRRTRRHSRHWYGGTMQTEFRNRQPPPSYNTSQHHQRHSQDVQPLSAAALAAQGGAPPTAGQQAEGDGAIDNYSLPSSPPPTYRSQASMARPGLHITFPPQQSDQPSSRPPTYRSHASTLTRPELPRDDDDSDSGDVTAGGTPGSQSHPGAEDHSEAVSGSGDNSASGANARTDASSGPGTSSGPGSSSNPGASSVENENAPGKRGGKTGSKNATVQTNNSDSTAPADTML